MPRNGSGTFTRVGGSAAWVDDRNASVLINAPDHDTHDQDIADALTASIAKNGETTTTAAIPFAAGINLSDGEAATPAAKFTSDTNTGIYWVGADTIGFSCGGTGRVQMTTAALSPVASDGNALGTSSLMWSDVFLASGSVVNWNNGDVTLTHSANSLAFAGGTSYTFDAMISPAASDGAALGSASVMWSDLFLASGGVVNWNNGDVTATHAANTLTFGGASSGYLFDAAVAPSASDGAALGSTSLMWSDAFLASGAVLNWNNGDVTITHAANSLLVAGGELEVSVGAANATGLRVNRTSGQQVANTVGLIEVMHDPNATCGIAIGSTNSNDTGSAIEFVNVAGTAQGSITVNGSATAFNTSSDGRLKDDLRPVFDALGTILKLDVHDFAWKSTGKRSVGLVAQEAINVIPQMVTHDHITDTWGIDYSKAVPHLIRAIQELEAKIKHLTS